MQTALSGHTAAAAAADHDNDDAAPVPLQVRVALRIIMGEDGSDLGAMKLRRLRENANYVRARLEAMGLHVYGDYNSPVIPVMLYMPGKIAAFSRYTALLLHLPLLSVCYLQ